MVYTYRLINNGLMLRVVAGHECNLLRYGVTRYQTRLHTILQSLLTMKTGRYAKHAQSVRKSIYRRRRKEECGHLAYEMSMVCVHLSARILRICFAHALRKNRSRLVPEHTKILAPRAKWSCAVSIDICKTRSKWNACSNSKSNHRRPTQQWRV